MSRFMKGNYELEKKKADPAKNEKKSTSEIFEDEALKKLGGSIAFVMKSNKFMWDDEDNNAD